jgi:hypothetical protein
VPARFRKSKAVGAVLGRLVLSRRERVIALEAYDKGLLGTTLRYPYEVRRHHPLAVHGLTTISSLPSTRSTPSARPVRPISRAKRMKAGG